MKKNKIKFIAHRGYSYIETENTMSSFKKALESDFHGVEIDIHLTKDKVVVVHHDDTTTRLSNESYIIKETMYDELKEVKLIDINTNEYTHKIPTLKEVLDLVGKYNKISIVEIKPNLSINDLKIVDSLLRSYENIIVISFHLDNLISLRKLNKNINLQFLTSKNNPKNFNICSKYNIDLDLNYKLINDSFLKSIKDKSFIINVWTVNDINIVKKLSDLNIDYITSDKISKIE